MSKIIDLIKGGFSGTSEQKPKKEESKECRVDQTAETEAQDFELDFRRRFDKEVSQQIFKRPNVLVCGYTGTGKTSLIRAVCGDDVVPIDRIGSGVPRTMNYDSYENAFIRLWDSKGLEMGDTEASFTEHTRNFVRERQGDSNLDAHIHLVWYVIQGAGARVTDCDLNLIRHIFNPKDLIVVISKADITRPDQLDAIRKRLMEAGVAENRIIACSDAESGSIGCTELVHTSYEMLPDAYRDAFAEAQNLDVELKINTIRAKRTKAKGIIAAGTSAAVAIGVTPIPVADSAMLVPAQVAMIASLAALYGLQKATVKEAALPFVARVVGMFTAASLLKLIPALGSTINAGVAAALTGAMGLYVQSSFEQVAIARVKGEPIPDLPFDVEAFRSYYTTYKNAAGKK